MTTTAPAQHDDNEPPTDYDDPPVRTSLNPYEPYRHESDFWASRLPRVGE